MLPPYLKIRDWDWIFGRAVKAISSLGVRSPCHKPKSVARTKFYHSLWYRFLDFFSLCIEEFLLCVFFVKSVVKWIKFINCEKDTKFEKKKDSTCLWLSNFKTESKSFQISVAFLEYLNFTYMYYTFCMIKSKFLSFDKSASFEQLKHNSRGRIYYLVMNSLSLIF